MGCWLSAGPLASFRPHKHAEASESWLWSSGLGQVFILQPSKALKPCSYAILLHPVFLFTSLSPFPNNFYNSPFLQTPFFIFYPKSFSSLVLMPASSPPPTSHLHPSLSHIHPRDVLSSLFNLPPISLWRSGVQWLQHQNVRPSYINI